MLNININKIWNSLEKPGDGTVFDPSMVDGLPDPAARYLLHSIKPGTPFAGSVEINMHGEFSTDPDKPAQPIRANQRISIPDGFIWKAKLGSGLIFVSGYDLWYKGTGLQSFKFWGLIPVVSSSGPDIDLSAAGRTAIESIFIPSSFLPGYGAVWTHLDEQSAMVTVKIGDREFELTLRVDSDGALLSISMLRWGQSTPSGDFKNLPFLGTDFSDERTFGGYTIPTRCSVGWESENGTFEPFFNPIIDNMLFE